MKKANCIATFLLSSLVFVSTTKAEDKPNENAGDSSAVVNERDVAKEVGENKSVSKAVGVSSPDVSGFGFGAGIGVNVLGHKSIESAKIINNVVRVESESNAKTQFWLEAHYSFGKQYTTWTCLVDECYVYDLRSQENKPIKKGENYFRQKRFFNGPFFAVNVSDSDSLINGAALGYMFSWRKVDEKEKPTGTYFNLGVGVSSSRIKELGAGLQDGQTVAAGTQIEYKTRDTEGLLILFSVGL